jgi:hypothetical protein
MRKILRIVTLVLVLISAAGWRAESKPAFDVKTLGDKEYEDFVFIKVKYRCHLKTAQDVELKIYALLGSGSKKKVASGNIKLAKVEKGYHLQTFMITPSHTANYGTPRKLRVEIWYKDRLAASKTKPGTKKKWWEEETMNIIVQSDDKIEKLMRDYKE